MIHMELQLGLALPSNDVKGFDLNCYLYEAKDIVSSDPSWNNFGCIGSVPRNPNCTNNDDICYDDICCNNNNKKRSFDEAFEQRVKPVTRTLPLLHWNKQPDDEDDPKDIDNNSSFGSNKITNEDGVVGWPPIKNWRKKLSYQHQGGRAKNNQTVKNGYGCGGRQSNSMFVKVNMEGVAITRKIDLSLYNSFETLTTTLINMFCLWHEESDNYKLAYQDREGDWLIAQDIPWRTFIRTLQRLKLSKSSG